MPKPAARLCLCLAIAAAAGGCMAAAPAAGARPRLILRPSSGAAGTRVTASLSGFRARSRGSIRFGRTLVARLRTDRRGRVRVRFRVPRNARGRTIVGAAVSIPGPVRRHGRGRGHRSRRLQRARAAFRTLAASHPGTPAAPLAVSADHPCGAAATPPARYSHVFVIVFENSNYSDIIGGRDTPYTTGLSQRCGSATRYFGLQRPSLPNYIALTSGGTQGINDDRGPSGGGLPADNIFNQVKQSGRQWRQYSSRMPSNCYLKDDPPSPNAFYTAHHEPAPYYADIRADCANWDVPLGTTSSGALASDLDRNTLPAFAWIGPADDGGNSAAGGEVDPKLGDPFLRDWVGRIVSSAAYRSGSTAILITWDEGDFNHSSGSPDFMNVPAIVVAPSVRPGTQVSTRLTHYSLLRTAEEMLGLPLLGHAADAGTPSMRSLFNL